MDTGCFCNLFIVQIKFFLLDVFYNCNIFLLPEMEKAAEVSSIMKVSLGSCGCLTASWLICWLVHSSSRMNLFPLSPRMPRVVGFHEASGALQHLFMMVFWKSLAAVRRSIMLVLSVSTRVWGETGLKSPKKSTQEEYHPSCWLCPWCLSRPTFGKETKPW